MDYQFLRTLWHGAVRSTVVIPPGFYLLPFSSWVRASPPGRLIVPTLPEHLIIAVDSGAYQETRMGEYRFSFEDYLLWIQALRPTPTWVVIPDWVAASEWEEPIWQAFPGPLLPLLASVLASEVGRADFVSRRQLRSVLMAYAVWDRYRTTAACWVPVIQGGNAVASYLWHALLLRPLIQEMVQHYGAATRIGVGGLVGRKASEIMEIITALSAVFPGIAFHLFGVKLRVLQLLKAAFPPSLPWLSFDSSQWNGQRVQGTIPGSKAWKESGMTQLGYAYAIALPSYEQQLHAAWTRLQSLAPLPYTLLLEESSVAEELRIILGLRTLFATDLGTDSDGWVDLAGPREHRGAFPPGDETSVPDISAWDQKDIYALYQAADPRIQRFPCAADWQTHRDRYYLAALVQAPRSDVFEVTNHVECNWTSRPEILWSRCSTLRSSAKGDVVVSCATKQAWMFAPVGWWSVPSDPVGCPVPWFKKGGI